MILAGWFNPGRKGDHSKIRREVCKWGKCERVIEGNRIAEGYPKVRIVKDPRNHYVGLIFHNFEQVYPVELGRGIKQPIW